MKISQKKENQKETERYFSGNPFKGLFGKFERPKYPDFWQEPSDEEKKELELFFKVFSGFFLSIFILTNILPENILDLVIPLNYFVKFMSSVFPTIAAFERLSEFPQIGQIIYSFCIITMPFQYLFIHRISISMKVWERLLKTHKRDDTIIALCIVIPLYIIFTIYTLYFATISEHTTTLTKYYHTSKISFSLITATAFFALAMLLSLIIFCAKKIERRKKEDNV